MIESIRLFLRPISDADLASIHELHANPEVDRFNTLGIPKDIEDTKSTIKPWILSNNKEVIKDYTLAIERKSDKKFIGLIGLKIGAKKYSRAEVWYKIHPNYWNNGYATESLNSILDFGFNKLLLHRIEAGCAVDNIASIKVLEKVGMTREGRCREILPLVTGWTDNFEYAILESDYRNKSLP